jgi:hypothetical protein
MKITELDLRDKDIDKQMAIRKKELEGIENVDAVEKELEKICLAYRKKINTASFELKRYIVRKWVEEININDDGSLNIKVKIPQGEQIGEKVFYVSHNVLQTADMINTNLRFEEVIRP